jgi:hypothetical protein
MAISVVVNGSHGGGWIWQKATPLLRTNGNDVYTHGLTGLSDRVHLLNCRPDLTPHIADVANLLFRVYIHCAGNPATTPDIVTPFAANAKAQGRAVREMGPAQLAMLAAPREVAALLPGIVGARAKPAHPVNLPS